MASTILIQDFEVSKTAVKIQLYMQYVFQATEGDVEVIFLSATDDVLKQINVPIPTDVYASWTTDDSTIENYILSTLGLTPSA